MEKKPKMSKILVIPDTHLKPKMFDLADKIMHENEVNYAVQLGDNVDDFFCYEDQYRNHSDRMLTFCHEHPNTIWLWGNHEVSYILDRPVTGNTYVGGRYARLYCENFNPKFVHIDNKVIFSHAGIFREFVDDNSLTNCKTADELIKRINYLNLSAFWCDDSPIWARPQYNTLTPTPILDGYLQVVGHTPMKNIVEQNYVISTDVFSTNWGIKVGAEEMIIVDTEKLSFKIIDIDYRKEFGEER